MRAGSRSPRAARSAARRSLPWPRWYPVARRRSPSRVTAQARPDRHVGPAAVLDVQRAERALAGEAGALGDRDRTGVVDVDPQLDPFQAELLEAPVREQPQRSRRDAAAARDGREDVPGFALPRLELELDERGETQERVVVSREDREPGA